MNWKLVIVTALSSIALQTIFATLLFTEPIEQTMFKCDGWGCLTTIILRFYLILFAIAPLSSILFAFLSWRKATHKKLKHALTTGSISIAPALYVVIHWFVIG